MEIKYKNNWFDKIFIKLFSGSITEKNNKNENCLFWNIFFCSLVYHFGYKPSLSFEKKYFWCFDPSAEPDQSWNDGIVGGKITRKFPENRAILFSKRKTLGKPKTELTIVPVSKIPPKKSLLIQ